MTTHDLRNTERRSDRLLCGSRLIVLYLALLATAAFVLTLLDPSGPF